MSPASLAILRQSPSDIRRGRGGVLKSHYSTTSECSGRNFCFVAPKSNPINIFAPLQRRSGFHLAIFWSSRARPAPLEFVGGYQVTAKIVRRRCGLYIIPFCVGWPRLITRGESRQSSLRRTWLSCLPSLPSFASVQFPESRPGPMIRCTSIAAPMTSLVSRSRSPHAEGESLNGGVSLARNLKTCGGRFSCLPSLKRRIVSARWGKGAMEAE